MPLKITKWSGSQIAEDEVRELHSPKEDYRISPQNFESGVSFPGCCREGLVYILSGSAEWTASGEVVQTVEGDILYLSSGSYEFKVLGDVACELIHVWDLQQITLETKKSNA